MGEPIRCRWCQTRLALNAAGLFVCAHCDENAHDPTGCTLCALGADRVYHDIIEDRLRDP